MKAAIASADITPQPGHVLQGHSNNNPSTAVLFPLEARAVVFENGGERAAIVALDLIGLESESVARIRDRVAGIQVSAPFGRIETSLAVIEGSS